MPDVGLSPASSPSTNNAPMAESAVLWIATACVAVALPTLLAFNLPPSATFLNQAVSVIGWGALLSVFAECLRAGKLALDAGLAALLGALAALGAAALAAPLWAALPWALSLSALGLVLAAMLVTLTGAALSRAGFGASAFRALCVALVVAGVLSMVIGIVQVFAPDWADGNWMPRPASPAARWAICASPTT